MASVNTNYGASIALQNLNATNRQLDMVQNRINTGLKVASARDNGAVWSIAETQRVRSESLDAVQDNIDRATSAIDIGVAAGEAINEMLKQMREKAVQAQSTTLGETERAALDLDFAALRDQIDSIVAAAEYNGINLVNGEDLTVLISDQTTANTMAVSGTSLGTAAISVGGLSISGSTTGNADAAVTAIDAALAVVRDTLSSLGAAGKSLEVQNTFLGKLNDTLQKSIGNLVDADLARESAKLQSLQIKQQLGSQALSIANQAPSLVLSLFR